MRYLPSPLRLSRQSWDMTHYLLAACLLPDNFNDLVHYCLIVDARKPWVYLIQFQEERLYNCFLFDAGGNAIAARHKLG